MPHSSEPGFNLMYEVGWLDALLTTPAPLDGWEVESMADYLGYDAGFRDAKKQPSDLKK